MNSNNNIYYDLPTKGGTTPPSQIRHWLSMLLSRSIIKITEYSNLNNVPDLDKIIYSAGALTRWIQLKPKPDETLGWANSS